MNPTFNKLSFKIYQNIHNTFKSKIVNQFALGEIYNSHRMDEYVYAPFYVPDKNLKDLAKFYDGSGHSFLATKVAKDVLSSDPNSIFKNFKVYYHHIDAHEALRKRTKSEHTFIKTTLKEDGLEFNYIIDPTYKQLFIRRYGYVNQFNSSYANYLYSLPPVYIGTIQELDNLISKLERKRNIDKFNNYDIIVDHWYNQAKEIENDKFDNMCSPLYKANNLIKFEE